MTLIILDNVNAALLGFDHTQGLFFAKGQRVLNALPEVEALLLAKGLAREERDATTCPLPPSPVPEEVRAAPSKRSIRAWVDDKRKRGAQENKRK